MQIFKLEQLKQLNKRINVLVFLLLLPISFHLNARDPIRGGTITAVPFYSQAHVNNFNPYELSSGAHYARDFIYEPLWIFNSIKPEESFPRLAKSYRWSEDSKELTFQLRKNVKFSDGEDFNADDVVFTANLLKSHRDLSQSINWYSNETKKGNLVDVIKVSDHTVKFIFKSVDHLAHFQIGKMYVLPEHIWHKVIHPDQFSNRNPVGTGPFTDIRVFEKNVIKLCRNPYYWEEGKPYIDCMQFPQIKNHEQAIIQAADGKIDWMNAVIANIKKYFTDKNPNNHFWFFPSGKTSIVLDTSVHPFSDFEFRKALSLAIDREYLLKVSQLSISSNESIDPILPLFPSGQENAKLGQYEYLMQYNPMQAKKTLKKAGFIDQDRDGFIDNPDGSRLAFHIAINFERTDLVNILEAIIEDLQDIGLNVRIKSTTQTNWAKAVKSGEYSAYIQGFDDDKVDINQVEKYIYTQNIKGARLDTDVIAQSSTQPLNELINLYQNSSPLDQSSILSEIRKLMAQELTNIDLISNARSYQYNDFYFQGWANQNNPFIIPSVQIEFPERVIHVLNLSLKAQPRYLIER